MENSFGDADFLPGENIEEALRIELAAQESLIELLHFVQSDYSTAKKQLGDVYQTFSQRETAVHRQLHSLLESSDIEAHPGKANLPVRDFGRSVTRIFLRACCLGKFEVYVGQRKLVHWHSLKAKALLKALVAQRGKHIPKDVLMESLWPGCTRETANSSLKTAIYALRQTLRSLCSETENNSEHSSSFVLFFEGKYTLNPEIELWVDVEEFQHHWSTGQRLEKRGENAQAISEYLAAEKLYRGDYLEDDLYEDWTLLQREALKDTYLTILAKLADNDFKTGDYQSCITYCQKILAKDSCREGIYQQLMRCYSRLGQRHRAIRWYELCVKTMKKELDLAPDAQTVELYQKLLRHEHI